MINIRPCQESEYLIIARLIADTYRDFNLTFALPQERFQFLGPFQQVYSGDAQQMEAIAQRMRAEILWVAADEGQVVGVIRGSKEKLYSLFVRGEYHHQGIGSRLLMRFEEDCRQRGSEVIRLTATQLAVPFYQKRGYKKSTGLRPWRAYGGEGMFVQPMKKILA